MTDHDHIPADESAALLPKQAPSPQPPRGDAYHRTTSRAGYAYILLATVGFASMMLLLRVAESNLGLAAPRALLLRAGVQTVLSGSILLYLNLYEYVATRLARTGDAVSLTLTADAPPVSQPLIPPRGALRWLALRGIFGAIGLLLNTFSIKLIPVGDATAIFFTVPVFTMLFAYLLIGEAVTRVDVIAAALSLLGGLMVGAPGGETGAVSTFARVSGSVMALGGAVMGGMAYTIVRKLGSSIHFLYAVLSLGVFGLALGVAVGGWYDVVGVVLGARTAVEGEDERLRLATLTGIASALGGFVGQCALSRGLQLCKAGPAILLRNLDVPVVYAVSVALLGEVPSLMRATGATIIVASALVIAVNKLK